MFSFSKFFLNTNGHFDLDIRALSRVKDNKKS